MEKWEGKSRLAVFPDPRNDAQGSWVSQDLCVLVYQNAWDIFTNRGKRAMENFSVDLLLDAVKKANGWESDYRLAKSLGINPNAVSNYRSKRSLPDELTVQKLAAAAGLDADVLTAQVQAARSRSSEAKSMWERIALRLQSAAVTASVSALFFFSPMSQDPHGALAGELPSFSNLNSAIYTSYKTCLIFATLFVAWILSK